MKHLLCNQNINSKQSILSLNQNQEPATYSLPQLLNLIFSPTLEQACSNVSFKNSFFNQLKFTGRDPLSIFSKTQPPIKIMY